MSSLKPSWILVEPGETKKGLSISLPPAPLWWLERGFGLPSMVPLGIEPIGKRRRFGGFGGESGCTEGMRGGLHRQGRHWLPVRALASRSDEICCAATA